MLRRDFLWGLCASFAWHGNARAQNPQALHQIGFVEAGSQSANQIFLSSFRDGLSALGWHEGQNISILDRWANARSEDIPAIVAQLIEARVDVLVTAAAPASLAAKRATSNVPIVAVGVPDPVGLKLVESLSRPGGNVTGLSSLSVDLTKKRMQLLKDALPAATRVGLLWNPSDPASVLAVGDAKEAASGLNLSMRSLEATTPAEIEVVFSALRESHPDSVFVVNDPLTVANREMIVKLANDLQIPVAAGFRAFAVAGALMSFGTSLPNDFRRAARFVDKILKGANPADLPIEQPTEFELVLNLKTAKALDLTISASLLAAANEVIE